MKKSHYVQEFRGFQIMLILDLGLSFDQLCHSYKFDVTLLSAMKHVNILIEDSLNNDKKYNDAKNKSV